MSRYGSLEIVLYLEMTESEEYARTTISTLSLSDPLEFAPGRDQRLQRCRNDRGLSHKLDNKSALCIQVGWTSDQEHNLLRRLLSCPSSF